MPRTPGEIKEVAKMKAASSAMIDVAQDAGKAIDEPWFVVRYMVRQALKQFKTQTGGKSPSVIHIPLIVEAALQVDAHRNLEREKGSKLNTEKELFGFPVVWNAKEFKIE